MGAMGGSGSWDSVGDLHDSCDASSGDRGRIGGVNRGLEAADLVWRNERFRLHWRRLVGAWVS